MKKHTITSTINEQYFLIGDWLIDSGCTIHMTLYIKDFISKLPIYQTMVETAIGGLEEVSMKGAVKVL
jgi:hypothetical protein